MKCQYHIFTTKPIRGSSQKRQMQFKVEILIYQLTIHKLVMSTVQRAASCGHAVPRTAPRILTHIQLCFKINFKCRINWGLLRNHIFYDFEIRSWITFVLCSNKNRLGSLPMCCKMHIEISGVAKKICELSQLKARFLDLE